MTPNNILSFHVILAVVRLLIVSLCATRDARIKSIQEEHCARSLAAMLVIKKLLRARNQSAKRNYSFLQSPLWTLWQRELESLSTAAGQIISTASDAVERLVATIVRSLFFEIFLRGKGLSICRSETEQERDELRESGLFPRPLCALAANCTRAIVFWRRSFVRPSACVRLCDATAYTPFL